MPAIMTRKDAGKASKLLSGYCVVVAENNEGKIKLFGSPADHASLAVGDEIIEVNGKKVEDSTHSEVITHIHESIKSRRVSLKVRRRKGKRLVDEYPTYSIQNAYIVSSNDAVRDSFNRLHKDDPVVPIDMTNLILDAAKPENQEITIPNAKLDAGISLVKSKPHISFETAEHEVEDDDEDELVVSSSVAKANDELPAPLQLNHIQVPIPDTHRSIEDLLQRTLRNIDTCIELSKKQEVTFFLPPPVDQSGGFHPLPPKTRAAVCINPSIEIDITTTEAVDHRTKEKPAPPDVVQLSASTLPPPVDMGTQIQFNNHREMAIDVPDAFVGAVKRPPRYPGTLAPVKEVVIAAPLPSVAMDEAERIKRYQADIRKRTEDEQSRARKDEFLRNSLRGSKKLQALEKNAKPVPPPGFFNAAFEEELNSQTQEEFPVYVGNGGVEIIDVPDSLSMKQALEKISAVLKRENGEFAEELDFIEGLFDSPQFQNAADLHHLIESRQLELSEPVATHAESLMAVVKKLLPNCSSQDAQELQAVLSTPQFENLLRVHDKLAVRSVELSQLRYTSSLDGNNNGTASNQQSSSADGDSSFNSDAPTMPVDENPHAIIASSVLPPTDVPPVHSNYVGADMKKISIEKSGTEPLGATVKIDEVSGAVLVARIVHGGAAQKNGELHEGDELQEVNGYDLRGKSLDEVSEILSKLSGLLNFVVYPNQSTFVEIQPKRGDYTMHVKANFSFDPCDESCPEETRCPCADLGLSFQKGDILHIRNQDDPRWWQAYREGEIGTTLAGLIPSKEFQQLREDIRLRRMEGAGVLVNGVKSRGRKDASGKKAFLKKSGKSKSRKKVVTGSPLDMDTAEVPWYEEVAVYYPKPGWKRPIVLLGPPNVGRQELRERLMKTDVDRFAAAIPHTTRAPHPGEINGHSFFFVTRHQFEADMKRGRFVEGGHYAEHGKFEKHLYGTSFDAVRTVVLSNKICILNLEPRSLRLLRASDLKPYVIFIAPPSLEQLRLNRQRMGSAAKDEELKLIIEDSCEMEETYGHFFDLVIVNSNFDNAVQEILEEINRLEREPQWVPIEWLR